MREFIAVSLLAAAVSLAAGSLGATQEQADTTEAPAEIRDRPNPVVTGPESIKAGRVLWEKHCFTCHGDAGRGDGPNARLHEARKGVKPRDLTDPKLQNNMTDGEIFWRVSKGLVEHGEVLMPSYEEKIPSEAQRWQLVHYVRSLRPLD